MELEDLSLEEEGAEAMSKNDVPSMNEPGMIDDLDLPEEESLTAAEETEAETLPPLEETAPGAKEGGEFEDISLDDLGIEIAEEDSEETKAKKPPTSEPRRQETAQAALPEEDDFPELSLDLEGDGDLGPAFKEETISELDEFSLPEEESLEEAKAEAPLSAPGAEESLPEIETIEDMSSLDSLEEIPELEYGGDETPAIGKETGLPGEEIEVPLSEDIAIEESEEELKGIESNLGRAKAGSADSASILLKIEAELRSIKAELTELKSELGMLRGKKSEDAKKGVSAKGAGKEEGDFFEEEEDETIALTGEELDNILTTADIKEEEKTESAPEKTEPEEAELPLEEDILTLEEEPGAAAEENAFAAADAGLEEITLDEITKEAGPLEEQGEIEIEIPELGEEVGAENEAAGLQLEEPEELKIEEVEPLDRIPEAGEVEIPIDDSLEEVGELELEEEPEVSPAKTGPAKTSAELPSGLKDEIKSVLGYMDQLLESLPEEKIEEFAKSEYFSIYKKLFEELGLVS
jgi:hypothetical protein